MRRAIIRHGFVLILLALISGLLVPAMHIPRLGLSAHTIGVLSGTLLVAIGAIWKEFALSPRHLKILFWAWLYASYVNWLGCLVGAISGAGKMTPLASAGVQGPAFAEALVAILLTSVAVVSFVAVGMSVWGLRKRGAPSS